MSAALVAKVNTFECHPIRHVISAEANEPIWIARDVCEVIGISKYRDAVTQLDADERVSVAVDTPGGTQQMAGVTEAGVWSLMMISRSPAVKPFKRWLTHEVLPQIRRTGSYGQTPAPTGPELVAAALIEANRMLTAKDERIAELEPKAEVATKLLDAEGDLSVRDAAQSLTRAGIKVGGQRLFGALEDKGWIRRAAGDGRYRVIQSAIEAGYMSVLPQSHYHPKTGVLVLDPPQPRVTPKGLQRLLTEYGANA